MDTLKALCALAVVCIFGCWRTETMAPTDRSTPNPPALVLTHDMSATYRYVPPPDSVLLREWAHFVSGLGGFIAFGLIGNPDSVEHLIYEAFSPLPTPVKNPTYLDTRIYEHRLDSVLRVNDLLEEEFVRNALAMIRRIPQQQQHTDINGRMQDIRVLLMEPGMQQYTPYWYVNTDGIQDLKISGLPIDTILRPDRLPPNITVFTCGWKNPAYPSHWIPLGSPKSLIPSLKSIISK